MIVRNNLRSSERFCGHVLEGPTFLQHENGTWSWIIANRLDLDITVAPSSPTWHTVLDVVGDLLTNRCQLKKLLFYRRLFGRFGKLSKLCRFVPKTISPIHAPRTMFEGSDDRPRPAALDALSAPARADNHANTIEVSGGEYWHLFEPIEVA